MIDLIELIKIDNGWIIRTTDKNNDIGSDKIIETYKKNIEESIEYIKEIKKNE